MISVITSFFFPQNVADIAAFIKEQDPDIVALQEVEYYTNRTGANTPKIGRAHV